MIKVLSKKKKIILNVFKNEPSKICGRQPLKNLKRYANTLSQIYISKLPKITYNLFPTIRITQFKI